MKSVLLLGLSMVCMLLIVPSLFAGAWLAEQVGTFYAFPLLPLLDAVAGCTLVLRAEANA